MRQGNLAVSVLQQVTVRTLQHAWSAAAEARRVVADLLAASAGFDADQFDGGIRQERVEDSDGVRSTAHAGEDGIGQPAFGFENLPPRLFADARWKSRTIIG